MLNKLILWRRDRNMQQTFGSAHCPVLVHHPLMVISRIKRRKGEQLEGPVLQTVPLLMQPLGVVA